MDEMPDADLEAFIVCNNFYHEREFLTKTFAFGLILLIIVFNLYMIRQIYLRRNTVPIFQRAPTVVIFQTSLYIATVLLPLLAETIRKWGLLEWSAIYEDAMPAPITDSSMIPVSRRLLKFLINFSRFSMSWVIPFRVAIIWFQWKGWQLRDRGKLWRLAVCVMTSQKKALALIVLVCLLLFVLLYGDGSKLCMWMHAFDWFDPDLHFFYRAFNVTYLRIVEAFLGICALFLVRYSQLTQPFPA